ncbi:GCN5-related N-acetyltransferase [Kribbella flavida DSM 17836]|uniref:GCN5-related N-acetyltransferase n=1 Tax=Kribbella flavida (strain DSM 17836 / JCM 10339 / NBRC 14399) TaxID=479435 RepID=D2PU14_KRIFD|nr:GNAT family N-acetyltransferase [Kribbella flavida]ADB33297.1 GCN5-related N-acetyltransferase [Kribbella flavida DSM 17836]
MAPDTHLIRPAVAADVEPLVRTLVRAFEDYPMTRQGLAADGYLDRLERYQRLFLTRIGLAHGKVWASDDHSAVAVWTTPRTPRDVFSPLAPELREIAGERALVAESYEQAMSVLRPREPLWFLNVVGVAPDRQGRGLGRAVIAPGLARADQDRSAAFLETQDAGNVGFYQSLGFEIVGEIALPHNGPTHWAMRRPPQR